MKAFLALLLSSCATAWAAIDYARFAHPAGDYVLEYPSHWKRSVALQEVNLHPPGKEADSVVISFSRFPVGISSPKTPQDFIARLKDPVGRIKKLDAEETVALKGAYGQKLPGPVKEIHLVLPQEGFYYALSLRGIGKAFEKALPEFERLGKTLKLKASKE
jgi:hypothetical protein